MHLDHMSKNYIASNINLPYRPNSEKLNTLILQ